MVYKQIEGFSAYYICDDGNVYKKNKNGQLKKLKNVKIPKVSYDGLRVDMRDDNGKVWSKVLNTLIYETFKRKLKRNNDKLFYIDGNYKNCSLSNLITGEELIDYYRKNNNIKINL